MPQNTEAIGRINLVTNLGGQMVPKQHLSPTLLGNKCHMNSYKNLLEFHHILKVKTWSLL